VPSDIVQMNVDGETGDLPTSRTKKLITEYFINGTAPGQRAKLANNDFSEMPNKPIIITGYGPGIDSINSGGLQNPQDSQDSYQEVDTEDTGETLRNDF